MTHPETFVSTGAFSSRALEAILAEATPAGVRRLELSSGVAWSEDLLARVRLGRRHFRFLVHNYFPPPKTPFVLNLAANAADARRQSLDHCRLAIDLAAELETDLYTVHAGFAVQPAPADLGRPLSAVDAIDLEAAYRIFLDSVGDLVAYGSQRGVRIGIENNVVAPFNLSNGRNLMLLMARADELLRLWRDVNSPRLGFLIDTGHLKVSATSLGFDANSFIDAVAPYILGWHLSDNDGTADSNKPFGRDAWFLPLVARHPASVIVIEAYRLASSDLLRCLDAVAHHLPTPESASHA